jgi:DNA-binding FadR family transcriptional regulator
VLPPERDLGRLLEAGRNSVREAVARLIADGILYIRPGVGTYVCGFVAEGSFELVRFVFRMMRGTPRAESLTREVLWLRRLVYVGAAELLVKDPPELEHARRAVHDIRWGNHFGYASRLCCVPRNTRCAT